ncbi:MerR family transcriptional regulator [Isobaculum melis]|uniref:DNA-binding transcriptional regulator, MerR family n=1 Tax=Isobaculum melis TaxID=142588 RepID=A0A1H9SV12_9LACT|nr:MerR family transcriptional regulator [Isobaculum melis]SER88751.1 DNA-binding transcriptional regulator, MerR family [Isobaculum melis]
MTHYSIQKMATLLNISKQTLRYYDTLGLVSPMRKENNYRYYTEQDKDDLTCILLLKIGGFTLEETALILKNRRNIASPEKSLENSKQLLHHKKHELSRKISSLQGIVALMETIMVSLDQQDNCSEINALVNQLYTSILENGKEL